MVSWKLILCFKNKYHSFLHADEKKQKIKKRDSSFILIPILFEVTLLYQFFPKQNQDQIGQNVHMKQFL